MRRRDFIKVIGGTVAWPLTARAQQPQRVKRIGMLFALAEDDPLVQDTQLRPFREALRALGWMDGENVRIDFRTAADFESMRSRAVELVRLGPDVIVTHGTPPTKAVRRAAGSLPIVFVNVSDPIEAGFVGSWPQPGGNITGFTNFEPTIGGKWLDLLKQVAPQVFRVAMLFNPSTANAGASGGVYLPSIEAAAHVLGIELVVSSAREPADIDGAFAAIAQSPGGGLIVMPNSFTAVHRDRIVAQAARFRIPTVYPRVISVKAGGLLGYGVDVPDMFRRAASYADPILRGAKPADLPVQQPTKFELAINLNTAKTLGLTVPRTLLALADEVIE
jgi:putative tryptophan/tyrosine transport system substrate-binding protein